MVHTPQIAPDVTDGPKCVQTNKQFKSLGNGRWIRQWTWYTASQWCCLWSSSSYSCSDILTALGCPDSGHRVVWIAICHCHRLMPPPVYTCTVSNWASFIVLTAERKPLTLSAAKHPHLLMLLELLIMLMTVSVNHHVRRRNSMLQISTSGLLAPCIVHRTSDLIPLVSYLDCTGQIVSWTMSVETIVSPCNKISGVE